MAKKKKVKEIEPLNLKPLIKQISKEKDLEPEVIKQAIESAILSAAQKRAKTFADARPDLDIESGDMRIYVKKKVVVNVQDEKFEIDILSAKEQNSSYMLGQEVDVEISPEEFGRIAAQSVRQGILQRLRDAERDRVYNDFKDKVGQVVTGIVQRYERRDSIAALGRVECLLPQQEIPMGVRYRFGDRVRSLIVDVRRTPKGPQVILSRTRSDLVKELFATEVPEISDGTVRIVEIAREPGVRTKIAVQSMDTNVDPVGACVGMKGSRVQMIVRELDNEKVDIVPWSPLPENFIRSALNPANIVNIKLNEVEKRAHVIVERDSLSKAIGKRGQNAKLAAKLTGWKIDIGEQEEAETLARLEAVNIKYLEDFLSQIEGLSDFSRAAMSKNSEYNSVEKLAEMSPHNLLIFTGNDEELAEEIVDGAADYLDGLNEMEVPENVEESEMSEEEVEFLRDAEDMANRLGDKKDAAEAEAAPESGSDDTDSESISDNETVDEDPPAVEATEESPEVEEEKSADSEEEKPATEA